MNGSRRVRVVCGVVLAAMVAAGLMTTSAAQTAVTTPAAPSSFVSIVPCRLVDTRPAPDTIGGRSTPITGGETYSFAVHGTNGACTIPASATAVALNVTAVGGTAPSYFTLFPPDAAQRPLTSNLNWVPGTAPTPNKVDVGLSGDGRLAVFNLAGAVDLVVDVFGYYESVIAAVDDDQPASVIDGTLSPSGSNSTLSTKTFTTTRAGRLQIEADLTAGANCLASGVPYIDYWLAVDGEFVAGSWVRRVGATTIEEIDLVGITTFTVPAGGHELAVRFSCDLVTPITATASGYDPPGITGLITVLPENE